LEGPTCGQKKTKKKPNPTKKKKKNTNTTPKTPDHATSKDGKRKPARIVRTMEWKRGGGRGGPSQKTSAGLSTVVHGKRKRAVNKKSVLQIIYGGRERSPTMEKVRENEGVGQNLEERETQKVKSSRKKRVYQKE